MVPSRGNLWTHWHYVKSWQPIISARHRYYDRKIHVAIKLISIFFFLVRGMFSNEVDSNTTLNTLYIYIYITHIYIYIYIYMICILSIEVYKTGVIFASLGGGLYSNLTHSGWSIYASVRNSSIKPYNSLAPDRRQPLSETMVKYC